MKKIRKASLLLFVASRAAVALARRNDLLPMMWLSLLLPLSQQVESIANTHREAQFPVTNNENVVHGDNVDNSCMDSLSSPPLTSLTALERARLLRVPPATDTENAEFENADFWEEVGPLLKEAWGQWDDEISANLSKEDDFNSTAKSTDSGGEVRVWWNAALMKALEDAFENPSEETEAVVKSLWSTARQNNDDEPLPRGVYAIRPLLTLSGIHHFRNLLDLALSSGIPTRRPNGMNRNGLILDSNVAGAVPMKSLMNLIEKELIDRVVRPAGRMLFPEWVGCDDDVEYFAFTIRYDADSDSAEGVGTAKDNTNDKDGVIVNAATGQECRNDITNSIVNACGDNLPEKDLELKEHRDASLITLNINLNLPEERYSGSEVYFREFSHAEHTSGTKNSDGFNFFSHSDDAYAGLSNRASDSYSSGNSGGIVRFSPGMAVIHLGAHRHGSLPISSSNTATQGNRSKTSNDGGDKRYNLVIWLFGKDGDVRVAPYSKEEQMSVVERWHGCKNT